MCNKTMLFYILRLFQLCGKFILLILGAVVNNFSSQKWIGLQCATGPLYNFSAFPNEKNDRGLQMN